MQFNGPNMEHIYIYYSRRWQMHVVGVRQAMASCEHRSHNIYMLQHFICHAPRNGIKILRIVLIKYSIRNLVQPNYFGHTAVQH